jgi:hypothetical protein
VSPPILTRCDVAVDIGPSKAIRGAVNQPPLHFLRPQQVPQGEPALVSPYPLSRLVSSDRSQAVFAAGRIGTLEGLLHCASWQIVLKLRELLNESGERYPRRLSDFVIYVKDRVGQVLSRD